MPEKTQPNRADAIELRYKELLVDQMEEEIANRRDRKERAAADRKRQYEDFQKNAAVMLRRQQICKHRKGGKNNQFWNGNSNDYSINKNIYPTGEEVLFCTRCGKEVRKPDRALKKTNPERYAQMWEEWKAWSALPTDNTPSGSKIFEVIHEETPTAA
jgi:hypothetical protein